MWSLSSFFFHFLWLGLNQFNCDRLKAGSVFCLKVMHPTFTVPVAKELFCSSSLHISIQVQMCETCFTTYSFLDWMVLVVNKSGKAVKWSGLKGKNTQYISNFIALSGVIIIPGTTQLTAPDICYGLLASKARCVTVIHAPAPGVDSVASKCQSLKTKLIVSESSRAEWLDCSHLLK